MMPLDLRLKFTRPLLILIGWVCVAITAGRAEALQRVPSKSDTDFFETQIRPLLVSRCQKCHGDKKQSGDFRVDSRSALIRGGDGGPALVPGQPQQSRLVAAIRHADELKMPPRERLTPSEIESIETWITLGAPWPATTPDAATSETATDRHDNHWAFQPVVDHAPPQTVGVRWGESPIDAFVHRARSDRQLSPAPMADRQTLIRRLHYTLTGLPPTVEEVARFLSDEAPHAYASLVDRLLASPAYGEHWGRHWLDLARYSDTKGYVYAREERRWVHAWSYRDWVVSAWNESMPYDRFLRLQLAADQVQDKRHTDLAAMGFLTLGRRFLGVNRDIIDDRIDVVGRGMLGLTVSCARCHDHKYDPIPTEDYYSLYGVFDSCHEQLVQLEDTDNAKFRDEWNRLEQALEKKLASSRDESSQRCRDRTADYLRAQQELEKYPANGFDQVFQKSDLLPAFVRRWETYLYEARHRNDPIFRPWHAYSDLPESDFRERARELPLPIDMQPAINRFVANEFDTPPESFDEVIRRYDRIFSDAATRWQERMGASGVDSDRVADPDDEALRQLLFGPDSPCVVPDEPIVHSETFFDSATCTDLWKRQGELDRLILQSDDAIPFALTLNDRDRPTEPRVFRRGNPLQKGRAVPRQFLTALSDSSSVFRSGSGRSELADAIIDPNNPLTARVIVNRVWAHHFGKGLVDTPSDFGTRADEPSHPQLLDWLASRFIQDGWDLKRLHRRILLSATYRQSSRPHGRDLPRAMQVDPENRLLWRMNPKRLSFEEYRDSLFATAKELDRTLGGKPAELFGQPYPQRRTIYGLVDRQYLPGTLRVFDFANPDLHVAKRGETTVPQQALFLLNHPLMLERATALANLAKRVRAPEKRVDVMFRQTLQRSPTQSELDDALAMVAGIGETASNDPPATASDWHYGYGTVNETEQQVVGFTLLPHFTGTAWQGGPKWPDPALGWVQLTASGGHPGNDRNHAAIRRWTAPQDMSVKIRSELVHQRPPGDGVRAFVVVTSQGILVTESVHQSSVKMNIDRLDVSKGDTIDFVVDIGMVLNSDEHIWKQTIVGTDGSGRLRSWNSETDFPSVQKRQLDAWEQLAQILLCTNEFTFVD